MILFLLLFAGKLEVSNALECVVVFPISEMPDDCTTITGSMIIDGSNETSMEENQFEYSVLMQKFSKVEQWEGTIKVLNTDFHNLSFFQSLKTVSYGWPSTILGLEINYITFWIESNENMTSLGMPNLTSVVSDVLPTNEVAYSIWIRECPELCMSEEEYWKIRRMTRSFMFDMKICEEKTSKVFCSEAWFTEKNMPLGCQVLMSGIWLRDVRNISMQSHLNDAFATVEEMHGPIVIFRTDFTNLSFPQLHTIRNQYYDCQDSWQWQVLIIRGNYFLTSIDFPKLVNFHHYGTQPQLTNSANYIWKYTAANCNLARRIPFFQVTDTYSGCGLIPIINDGQLSQWVLVQAAEKLASFLVTLALCFFLALKVFRSSVSVNFFHFAVVTLILLTMVESLFVNLDYVHIFNDHGFAIPYGIRSILITHDSTLFNQISNVMYVNRLSLIISSSVYRSLYILGENYEKYGLLLSCAIFVFSNVWNLSVMEDMENKYTYVLYQLNWIALLVTLITAVFVRVVLEKVYSLYTDIAKHHNQLSIAFCLQAIWTFLLCGYSDGLNQYFAKNYQFVELVRWYETFIYWYGGVIFRWHYTMLIIILIAYLPSTFVKFPHTAKVTTVVSGGSSSNKMYNN